MKTVCAQEFSEKARSSRRLDPGAGECVGDGLPSWGVFPGALEVVTCLASPAACKCRGNTRKRGAWSPRAPNVLSGDGFCLIVSPFGVFLSFLASQAFLSFLKNQFKPAPTQAPRGSACSGPSRLWQGCDAPSASNQPVHLQSVSVSQGENTERLARCQGTRILAPVAAWLLYPCGWAGEPDRWCPLSCTAEATAASRRARGPARLGSRRPEPDRPHERGCPHER